MQVVENSNGPSLGIYLNWATWPKASDGDWPEWATLRQREKWREKGLILWDPEARLVTRIDGREAVSFLDHLRNSTVWREDGCTVGEPVWLIPLSEPAEKAKWVLQDAINLSPQQTQLLLDYLLEQEERLQQMAAAEEKAQDRALTQVCSLLIEIAEQGKHTIYDESLSWEENKKLMRTRWESRAFPTTLTFTEKRLWSDVLGDIVAEHKREEQKAQERVLRIKKNLLAHRFFWERVKTMWPYLKASERLHILQLLRDREWNQHVITEIKEIVENAQFFESITTRMGTTPDVEKMTDDELKLLSRLDDEYLFDELVGLYRPKRAVSFKDKPQDKPLT